MKYLNIVIYNDNKNERYQEMYKILNEYYSIYDNVKTIYIKYSNDDMEEEYKLEGNILTFKGEETFIPGILNKTLSTFLYFEKELDNYDYIIRTNISTIINFDLLDNILIDNPIKDYGGGELNNLQWFGGGINDKQHFGTYFYSGTAIILTKESIRHILKNINLVRRYIIDDVSIAIYFKEIYKKKEYHNIDKKYYMKTPYILNNIENFKNIIKNNDIIFYRNKIHNNRHIDIEQMKIIKDVLLHKKMNNNI